MPSTPEEFIESFLEHRSDYDPEKAREYYLRTRKLKGRKAAAPTPPGDPRAYKDGYGKPLPKLGKRFEEDQSPLASPGGSTRVVAYDSGPHGLGRVSYADGHIYDGQVGWIKPQPGHARVNAAQAKLDQVRNAAKKASPAKRAALTAKINDAQKKLDTIKRSTKSRANQ